MNRACSLGLLMAASSTSINVLYFAGAQSAVKLQRETVALPESSAQTGFPLAELAALLIARHPHTGLDAVLQTSQWSVDEEMVTSDDVVSTRLQGGETVAVIPPVSGG